MKISKSAGRRRSGAVAATIGFVLVLSACSTTASDTPEPAGPAEITFTYAYEQELDSYNVSSSGSNGTQNAIVMNRVTPGFWRFAADGSLEPETDFGTYTKTSDDPLTVEYEFADKAVWSDGEPIDCDDAWLAYIANSGKYKKFDPAGSTGYDLISDFTCADGEKKFTVVYSEPFADWEGSFGSFLPAHVLERETGIADFIEAAKSEDKDAMAKAGAFWRNDWTGFAPGELPDEALIPSAGPYKLASWVAGQSITLTANDKWWGTPPKAKTVVIRFIAQDGQAQALQNGEIQAMDPQPNPDLTAQLEAIGDSIAYEASDQFTFEHLDYNFKRDVWKDARVREAFAHCVPRQQIIDNLIKPQNPDATVLNSRYFFPFQDQYSEVVGAIVGDAYDTVDVERSKALLAEAGAKSPTVKIGYIAGNQRRADAFALIADSCGKAGFKVTDGGSETFFDESGELVSGNFDIAMFAWAGSPLVTGASSTYVTDGGNNFGGYSNKSVDDLIAKLNVTPDKTAQVGLIKQVETILWDDLMSIPLFTFPGIVAYSTNSQGVVYNASQAGLTWNMEDWTIE
jgi:ABC-type transport system substrate-binding protein